MTKEEKLKSVALEIKQLLEIINKRMTTYENILNDIDNNEFDVLQEQETKIAN